MKHFLFALLASFALVGDAQDQAGFISIDCGLQPDVENYTEKVTGLNFISDQKFIDTGERKVILENYKNIMQKQYSSLRSFPEGNRNCYKIKDVSAGTKYLIRAGFMYGDYDGQDLPPMFDLYIGNDLWDTVRIADSRNTVNKEIIHIPPKNHVLVCLANNGHGIPFISTLELRPLDAEIYQTQTTGSLALAGRWDVGSSNGCRFAKDLHDRFWDSWQPKSCKSSNTTLAIDPNNYNIPSVVMSSASVPIENGYLCCLNP